MSYNTRRSGGNFGQMNANSPIGNIGQRRAQGPLGNNFVPGGQLSQGNKPPAQQQNQQQYQQQKPVQQQQQPQQFRQAQQPPQQSQQQQSTPTQQPPPQQPPQPQPPQQQQQQPPQQPQQHPPQSQTPQQNNQQPFACPKEEDIEGNTNEEEAGGVPFKRKPFWLRRPQGKISKKERLRRRNNRLRKILQPKNAIMVLNELIGSTTYNTSEGIEGIESIFRASVIVDGVEHAGIGKSKGLAKQSAAENALKFMVLNKLKNEALSSVNSSANTSETEENPNMETDEETQEGVSWSHVASFALHKLLTSWDEGGNLTERIAQVATSGLGSSEVRKVLSPGEKRPAKKLPDNPATMNPIMLLNQMRPNAVYEEVGKSGNPPQIRFTMKCTTDGEVFLGTGSNKKAARKQCAYIACRKILGIQYPPEIIEAEGLDKPAPAPMQMG